MVLVAFEGIDCSGKTSIGKEIAGVLKAALWHFPNDDSPSGEAIRAYLRGEWHFDRALCADGEKNKFWEALAFQSLQTVNRLERMRELQGRIAAGMDTVLVRYWPSGWVYGQLDGLDGQYLHSTHETFVQPDLNILLCVEPEEAMRRRSERDGAYAPERYEAKLESLQQAAALYEKLWARMALVERGKWIQVNAMRPYEEVASVCAGLVRDALPRGWFSR